jgi:hypothetical protein
LLAERIKIKKRGYYEMTDNEQYGPENERRSYPQQDSSLTVKWWTVLGVILTIFGFFFVTIIAHESRLTKIETITTISLANIEKNMGDLKTAFERHEQQNK